MSTVVFDRAEIALGALHVTVKRCEQVQSDEHEQTATVIVLLSSFIQREIAANDTNNTNQGCGKNDEAVDGRVSFSSSCFV